MNTCVINMMVLYNVIAVTMDGGAQIVYCSVVAITAIETLSLVTEKQVQWSVFMDVITVGLANTVCNSAIPTVWIIYVTKTLQSAVMDARLVGGVRTAHNNADIIIAMETLSPVTETVGLHNVARGVIQVFGAQIVQDSVRRTTVCTTHVLNTLLPQIASMVVSLDTGVMTVAINVTVKMEQLVIGTMEHVLKTCVNLVMAE